MGFSIFECIQATGEPNGIGLKKTDRGVVSVVAIALAAPYAKDAPSSYRRETGSVKGSRLLRSQRPFAYEGAAAYAGEHF